jgi:hypothetical protein
MSLPALEDFSITRHAVDPRADGARRTVHLSADGVVIERAVQGIRMKVGVPVQAYRDLVICLRPASGRATLKLRHDDSELDVVIGSGEALEVARSARAWSIVTGKTVAIEASSVAMRAPFARKTSRKVQGRRSRFAQRRKPGHLARLTVSFAGEREIIART